MPGGGCISVVLPFFLWFIWFYGLCYGFVVYFFYDYSKFIYQQKVAPPLCFCYTGFPPSLSETETLPYLQNTIPAVTASLQHLQVSA